MTRSYRWAIVCACVVVAGGAAGFVIWLCTAAPPSQPTSESASVHGATESQRKATVVTLKLKRATGGTRNLGFAVSSAGLDLNYLYGAASRQSLWVQVAKDGKPIGTSQGGPRSDFDRIVKKEPKYECDWPLRGVFQLGSRKYAFALDMASPPPTENDSKDKNQSKDAKGAKDAKPSEPKEKPSKSKPSAPSRWPTIGSILTSTTMAT